MTATPDIMAGINLEYHALIIGSSIMELDAIMCDWQLRGLNDKSKRLAGISRHLGLLYGMIVSKIELRSN